MVRIRYFFIVIRLVACYYRSGAHLLILRYTKTINEGGIMQSRKMVFITVIFAIALLSGLITNVDARPSFGSGNSGGATWYYNPTPPLPSPAPHWFPHSFPHIWSADDVVNVFTDRRLEVEEPEFITETDRFGLPAKTKELIKFSIPSVGKEIQGCILVFELKEDLRKNRNYYSDLNDKGHPYTWSFLKDNILLVIDGAVPEEKAKQYESALTGLKQK